MTLITKRYQILFVVATHVENMVNKQQAIRSTFNLSQLLHCDFAILALIVISLQNLGSDYFPLAPVKFKLRHFNYTSLSNIEQDQFVEPQPD